MKRSTRSRKTANLSKSVTHQLNMYALSASAAGVGALALAQPAEAKVIYTPAHHRFFLPGNRQTYWLDLNHDGIIDFKLHILTCGYSCRFYREFFIGGDSTSPYNVIAINGSVTGLEALAGALKKGSAIPGTNKFYRTALLEGSIYNNNKVFGNWFNAKDRYLGLAFGINTKIHYGWARLSVQSHKDPLTISAVLTGYAYETIPNKPIIAGKTKGPDVVTVQPATLGHLAHGAAAIPAWRGKDH